jgi:hypothetical protein
MNAKPEFKWTQYGLGYWSLGDDVRVDRYGKTFHAYRILENRHVEHVCNANGRAMRFRSHKAAMTAAENKWKRG